VNIEAPLIKSNENALSDCNRLFSLEESTALSCSTTRLSPDRLTELEFLVSRQPNCLLAHVQRIYHCFQANLPEQLYGALIDLLLVLNRQGVAISRRLVIGSKSKLSTEQQQILVNYLNPKHTDNTFLPGSPYSLFSKGLISNIKVVQKSQQSAAVDYDVLTVARDYIIYDQLEQAQNVLEEAILMQPSRQDLHHELLEIYQSIHNLAGFNRMRSKLTQLGFTVPEEWERLNHYFKGINERG